MFKEMRRKDREQDRQTADAILRKAQYGIFAVNGENGYPTPTPFNHVYDGENIYIHLANDGYTAACVRKNSRACFTVVTRCDVVDSEFVTNYESVMAYGTASIADDAEKRSALKLVIEKFSANFHKEGMAHIDEDFKNTTVIKLHLEHVSCKIRKG